LFKICRWDKSLARYTLTQNDTEMPNGCHPIHASHPIVCLIVSTYGTALCFIVDVRISWVWLDIEKNIMRTELSEYLFWVPLIVSRSLSWVLLSEVSACITGKWTAWIATFQHDVCRYGLHGSKETRSLSLSLSLHAPILVEAFVIGYNDRLTAADSDYNCPQFPIDILQVSASFRYQREEQAPSTVHGRANWRIHAGRYRPSQGYHYHYWLRRPPSWPCNFNTFATIQNKLNSKRIA